MKIKDWLALFKRYQDKKIFAIQHLKLLTGMNDHTLRMALKRLTDKEILSRICRGYYANPFNLPTLEEISAQIYKPSYISLETALSKYGILSQMPYVLTCITTKLPSHFQTSFGEIKYQQIQKKYYFGFIQENQYQIAEPEKALADFIYLNQGKKMQSMIAELDLEDIKKRKLKTYSQKMKLHLPEFV